MFRFMFKILDFVIDTALITSNNQKYRDIAINNNIKYNKK